MGKERKEGRDGENKREEEEEVRKRVRVPGTRKEGE